jgi:hypothetical protein
MGARVGRSEVLQRPLPEQKTQGTCGLICRFLNAISESSTRAQKHPQAVCPACGFMQRHLSSRPPRSFRRRVRASIGRAAVWPSGSPLNSKRGQPRSLELTTHFRFRCVTSKSTDSRQSGPHFSMTFSTTGRPMKPVCMSISSAMVCLAMARRGRAVLRTASPLRLPSDHGTAAEGSLGGRQTAGAALVAGRRAAGAAHAAQAGPAGCFHRPADEGHATRRCGVAPCGC